jgi:hypothetical protein
VSLTETAVNHRIEEWRLIVQEAKAQPERKFINKRYQDVPILVEIGQK